MEKKKATSKTETKEKPAKAAKAAEAGTAADEAKRAAPKAKKEPAAKAPAKKESAKKPEAAPKADVAPEKPAAPTAAAPAPAPVAAKPAAPKPPAEPISAIPSFEDIAALASATAEAYTLHVSKRSAAPEVPKPPVTKAAPATPVAPATPPALGAGAPAAAKPAVPGAPGAVAPKAPAPLGAPAAAALKPAGTPGAVPAKPPVAGAPGAPRPPLVNKPLKAGTGPTISLRPPVGGLKPGVPGIPAVPPRPAAPPVAGKPGVPPAAPARPAAPAPLRTQAPAPARPAAPPPISLNPPAAPAEKAPLKKLAFSGQVTVRELAEKLGVKVNDLIKKLMGMGVFATINQRLDDDTATLIASEFGYDLEIEALYGSAEIAKLAPVQDAPADLKPRSPVVTVMGHVDHGKTSLLDAIRTARVAEKEAGGITQHIGAYKVSTAKGDVVFLDTPGHEAFTAMRARGAKVTDLVILVVSASDGVMPQTIEAIDHAKAAGVPIVVAVNKVDLPTANPQKIRQELAGLGLNPEEWGGKTIFIDVSAKKRLNIDKLLEMVALQAEILELKANPSRPGMGVILEARLDARRGNVGTLLVQTGSVKVGDSFVAGQSFGRVRALIDDQGRRVQEVGPSTPVELLGIGSPVPQAGDVFNVVTNERQAREIAEKRSLIQRAEAMEHQRHVTLIGLKSAKIKELKVILKADVQGSVQALKDSLEKLSTGEITLKVLHSGVGNVNESDVLLAHASDAIVLAFHVDVEPRATAEAERLGIDLRPYSIIYDLIGDVKAAMEGLLEPELVDVVSGRLEIKQVFAVAKAGKIAGCIVTEGKIQRGGLARLVRDGKVLHTAKISGLKRFKDDVREVEKGVECGVSLEGINDYKVGDRIEAYVQEKRTRRLESSSQ